MGKNGKKFIKCPACAYSAPRWWAQSHCGECGTAFAGAAPKGGGGEKGSGKKNSKDTAEPPGSVGGGSSSSPRPKPAEGFRFATATILELLPLDGKLRAFLRLVEGEKDKESLLAAAALCPGLEEAALALTELRWPPTTPDKECQRELTRAQGDERTAEKALGDAKAATVKARQALTEAEAAEAKAATDFEDARVKAAALAAKLGALKGAEAPADVVMAPTSATVILESELGTVRKMIDAREKSAKLHSEKLALQTAKAAGKGKGVGAEARAGAEPYAEAASGGEAVFGSEDLQILVDDQTQKAAAAKEMYANLEGLQKQMNTALAQLKLMATAENDL